MKLRLHGRLGRDRIGRMQKFITTEVGHGERKKRKIGKDLKSSTKCQKLLTHTT